MLPLGPRPHHRGAAHGHSRWLGRRGAGRLAAGDIVEQGRRAGQGERDGVSPRVRGGDEGGAPVRRSGAWRWWQVLEHHRDEASEEPKKKGGKSQSMELTARRQWRRRLRNLTRDGGSGTEERTHGFGKSRGGVNLLRRGSACARKGGERWALVAYFGPSRAEKGGVKGAWERRRRRGPV
jgi:hypothetical protein